MKIKNLFLIVLFLIINKISLSQTPTYTLKVDSMKLVSINTPNDAIEFGIYLTHTNAPTHFGLAGDRFTFSFNPGIVSCTVTDTSCLKYSIIESQLPVPYQPRSPGIGTASNPSATLMRTAINAFQGTPGLDITGATNLLMVRMRLWSRTGSFNQTYLSMAFRNPPIVVFTTKLFAYINNVDTDITTPETHTIDSTGIPSPLGTIETVSLINPLNNSINNPLSINFIWNKKTNAISYRLQVSSDSLFNSFFYNDSTLTDTIKTLSGLNRDIKYFWKVRGKDSTGNYFYSDVWNFRTIPPLILKLSVLPEGLYFPLFNLMSRRDTIRTYLRNVTSPYNTVDSANGVIDSVTFTNKFIFNNASSGTYYIAVKHFNSIETWSKASGQPLITTDTNTYNFTTAASQAFGNNMKLKGSKYCMYSGDINQDGIVDGSDLIRIHTDAANFVTGVRIPTDLNGDNFVDGSDHAIGDNNGFNYVTLIRP